MTVFSKTFCSHLAEFFEAKQSFLFAKGRVGLYAGLRAMNLPQGSNILMPGYTCMVVPSAAQYVGLTPVYVDIDPETYNIDPALLDAAAPSDTAALIVQHTYGIPCNMAAIGDWTQRRGIPIIEDCCHSLGTMVDGRLCGSFGKFAFMSGQWNKPFSTGLGGMLLVNDPTLADAVERLVESELEQPSEFANLLLRCQIAAYDLLVWPASARPVTLIYRALNRLRLVKGSSSPSEYHGVMPDDYFTAMAPCQIRRGLKEISKIEEYIRHRAETAAFYHEELPKLGFQPLSMPDVERQPLLRYPVRVANKAEVLSLARRKSIEIGGWFERALHPKGTRLQDFGYEDGMCPESERAAREVVNLPTHLRVDARVADGVLTFLRQYAQPVRSTACGDIRPARVSTPVKTNASAATASPRVSIVIPCCKEVTRIRQCLESVDKNDFPKDRMELLVVDGMSEDGTRAVIEEFAGRHSYARMLDNPKQITSAALNIGIAACQGDVIMRMDVHVEYPSNYISSLVTWLLKSGADNVGGVCITCPANDSAVAKAIAFGMSHPVGVGDSYFRIGASRPCWVDTVPFGCYRREVFERVGGFDEELVRDQDDELNARIIYTGGRILLAPDVVCRYYARDSLWKLCRMFYQYGYFKPLVTKKLGHLTTVRQLAPPLLVVMLLLSAALAPWSLFAMAMMCLLLGAYAGVLVLGIRQAAKSHGWRTAGVLLPVFLTLHFGYGIGYLKGFFDFWILRRCLGRRPTNFTPTR